MKYLTKKFLSLFFVYWMFSLNILLAIGNPWSAPYEHMRVLERQASLNLDNFQPQTGIWVTERNSQGAAIRGAIRLLVDNKNSRIAFLSPLNNWGKSLSEQDWLIPDKDGLYHTGNIPLYHKMEYRLLIADEEHPKGFQVIDPNSFSYSVNSPFLNSRFWDFNRPGAYQLKNRVPDLRKKAMVIAETDVYALVAKYQGGPKDVRNTFRFTAESGVISKIKAMGYNAIEFLPFSASLDSLAWQFRYQVFGLWAPDPKFGTPEDFMHMIDQFNGAGIQVIMDAVIGHYPFQGNEGVRSLAEIGPSRWKKADGRNLFGQDKSPWNTYRYDYENPYIRQYLVDAQLFMMKQYGIGGIRFDNYDGVRFHGGGVDFLIELTEEIRKYRPEATLIAEMFYGENAVLRRLDEGGLGINYRTHSDLFDFVKDNLKGPTEHINMLMLQEALRNPWSWQEAPRVHYLTNHDEAANGRNGATGSYPVSLISGGEYYEVGKINSWASLMLFSGGAYLDMPQMRMMQHGSFSNNPAIDWNQLNHNRAAQRVNHWLADASKYIQRNEAFAFFNAHYNIENHTDYDGKVISLARYNYQNQKRTYVLINLGHHAYDHYRFGIEGSGRYYIVLDSDSVYYGGTNRLGHVQSQGHIDSDNYGEHEKPYSLVVPHLAPYGVVVFEQQ